MKKFLIFPLTLIFSFTLSACVKNPPSFENRVGGTEQKEGELLTYTGIIEPIQITLYQEGTHQIKTEEGGVVMIQSPTINLNNYVNKKVTIRGSIQKLGPNEKGVFTVTEIQLLDAAEGEMGNFESIKWSFGFDYPAQWILFENTDGVSLKNEGVEMVKVTVYNLDTSLENFVAAHEIEDGTPVTVAGQKSLRYTSESKIRLYIPNLSKKKVYKIENQSTEDNKPAFYTLLESFKILEGKTIGGDKCGGVENITCPEGFRCELQSGEDQAEGACVPVEDKKTALDCPFVAKPDNCTNFEPSTLGLNGCPTSYKCLDAPTEEPLPKATSPTTKPTTINQVTPTPEKTVSEPSSEPEDELEIASIPEIKVDSNRMRLYENTKRNFSMNYPRNWYYESFGAIEGHVWAVGFADKELDGFESAIVTLVIEKGEGIDKKELKGDRFIIQVPRDTDTHFVLNGPLWMKDVLEAMGASLTAK